MPYVELRLRPRDDQKKTYKLYAKYGMGRVEWMLVSATVADNLRVGVDRTTFVYPKVYKFGSLGYGHTTYRIDTLRWWVSETEFLLHSEVMDNIQGESLDQALQKWRIMYDSLKWPHQVTATNGNYLLHSLWEKKSRELRYTIVQHLPVPGALANATLDWLCERVT